MIKKAIYGLIGALIGVLFYFNLATDLKDMPIVKSERNEFKIEEEDRPSWNDDDNEYVEVFKNESYHVPTEVLGALSNDYLFSLGRANPMQYWKQTKIKPVENTEKEEDKKVEVADSDASGGTVGINNISNITTAYNTTTKKIESIDISSEIENFKSAQMPISTEGYRVTSRFGSRIDPVKALNGITERGMHLGYDMVNKETVEIKGKSNVKAISVLDGVIKRRETDNGGYGNFVEVDHGEYTTLYAHLDSLNDALNVGDDVSKGELLGFIGTTGNSTGPHLHFEVTRGIYKINPESLINTMRNN